MTSTTKALRCWIDLLVAPAFLALTAVAILSTLLPVLQELASHGKTRIRKENQRIHSPPSSIFDQPQFWVHKRFFLHFYVVGCISLVVFLVTTDSNTDNNHNQAPPLPTLLLFLHLTRRWYECCSVHKYLPQSQMHLAGYICGIFHYLFLPFLLLETNCCPTASTSTTTTTTTTNKLTATTLFSLLCLAAQHEQYQHHRLLSNLRTNINSGASNIKHKIPQGRGFHYVSCPHYLAEIGIYVALLGLFHRPPSPFNPSSSHCWVQDDNGGILLLPDGIVVVLIGLREWRHSVLLLWVACNLTVTALRSHQWYLDTFPVYPSLNRRAIFPGIL